MAGGANVLAADAVRKLVIVYLDRPTLARYDTDIRRSVRKCATSPFVFFSVHLCAPPLHFISTSRKIPDGAAGRVLMKFGSRASSVARGGAVLRRAVIVPILRDIGRARCRTPTSSS